MGQSMNENVSGLLELIDQQGKLIVKQNDMIAKLVNETAEKENYIQAMLEEG